MDIFEKNMMLIFARNNAAIFLTFAINLHMKLL